MRTTVSFSSVSATADRTVRWVAPLGLPSIFVRERLTMHSSSIDPPSNASDFAIGRGKTLPEPNPAHCQIVGFDTPRRFAVDVLA